MTYYWFRGTKWEIYLLMRSIGNIKLFLKFLLALPTPFVDFWDVTTQSFCDTLLVLSRPNSVLQGAWFVLGFQISPLFLWQSLGLLWILLLNQFFTYQRKNVVNFVHYWQRLLNFKRFMSNPILELLIRVFWLVCVLWVSKRVVMRKRH